MRRKKEKKNNKETRAGNRNDFNLKKEMLVGNFSGNAQERVIKCLKNVLLTLFYQEHWLLYTQAYQEHMMHF